MLPDWAVPVIIVSSVIAVVAVAGCCYLYYRRYASSTSPPEKLSLEFSTIYTSNPSPQTATDSLTSSTSSAHINRSTTSTPYLGKRRLSNFFSAEGETKTYASRNEESASPDQDSLSLNQINDPIRAHPCVRSVDPGDLGDTPKTFNF